MREHETVDIDTKLKFLACVPGDAIKYYLLTIKFETGVVLTVSVKKTIYPNEKYTYAVVDTESGDGVEEINGNDDMMKQIADYLECKD